MAIYLDHNASTPPDSAVIEGMEWVLRHAWGNPSTLYSRGRQAKALLDAARARVAQLIGAPDPAKIVFTSSGTEGDSLALTGVARGMSSRGNHIVTNQAEHKAVLRACVQLEGQGYRVTYLPVDRLGRVDPQAVRRALTPSTILVSVMLANNEVGTINPLAEIAAICREAGVPLHTDAVPAVGKMHLDVNALGVDFLTLSGHKIYGPSGIGALWLRNGAPILPVLVGGGQERGLRAGTQNLSGAHGLGIAAELARVRVEEDAARIRALRDRLWKGIRAAAPKARSHGDLRKGLSNVLNVSFPGWKSEDLVEALDREGIEVGTGSACTTGQTTASHVLLAMGVGETEARSSIRFTLGRGNTPEEMDATIAIIARLCGS